MQIINSNADLKNAEKTDVGIDLKVTEKTDLKC